MPSSQGSVLKKVRLDVQVVTQYSSEKMIAFGEEKKCSECYDRMSNVTVLGQNVTVLGPNVTVLGQNVTVLEPYIF